MSDIQQERQGGNSQINQFQPSPLLSGASVMQLKSSVAQIKSNPLIVAGQAISGDMIYLTLVHIEFRQKRSDKNMGVGLDRIGLGEGVW